VVGDGTQVCRLKEVVKVNELAVMLTAKPVEGFVTVRSMSVRKEIRQLMTCRVSAIDLGIVADTSTILIVHLEENEYIAQTMELRKDWFG
jgi:hypothetical protein